MSSDAKNTQAVTYTATYEKFLVYVKVGSSNPPMYSTTHPGQYGKNICK